MGLRRHPFTPGFDAVEARLLMATTASPLGNSSASANPILYAYTQAYLSHLGQSNYNPALDADHNGVINGRDADPLLKSLIPQTPPTHLQLTLALGPHEQANTPHPANEGGVTRSPTYVTIIGRTTPNSLVFTDDSNNDFRFKGGSVIAVNAEGWFTDTVEISGPYKFGQHNFQVVTPSLQVIRRAFPILQLVTPVKPKSGS
jgi:hypothetical protein